MYTAAYVNGEAQQKSMHVDVRIPKLELSASKTTLLAPGDSDTFVATGDLPMVIEGWNFAPDTVGGSSPDATVGSTWGACVANASTCTNYVSRSGRREKIFSTKRRTVVSGPTPKAVLEEGPNPPRTLPPVMGTVLILHGIQLSQRLDPRGHILGLRRSQLRTSTK